MAMVESAELYKNLHTQSSSILFRTERKLRMTIAFVRSRTGANGMDLVNAVFPKIEILIRDLNLAFGHIDSNTLGDLSEASTWSKFGHKSNRPVVDLHDLPSKILRKLTTVQILPPNHVNLYIGKISALISECIRLDDTIQLTEDARFEVFRMFRYVKSDLTKILRKTSHFGKKQFQCARCCLARELKEVLNLLLRTRPHWVSPCSRESLRYCNPRVYYL